MRWKTAPVLGFRHLFEVSRATCVHSRNVFVKECAYLTDVAGVLL